MKISYAKVYIEWLNKPTGFYITINGEQLTTYSMIHYLNMIYEDFIQIMKICNARYIDYGDDEYQDFLFDKKEDIEQAITMLKMLEG